MVPREGKMHAEDAGAPGTGTGKAMYMLYVNVLPCEYPFCRMCDSGKVGCQLNLDKSKSILLSPPLFSEL